jgi:multiple sugar transport system permease protein
VQTIIAVDAAPEPAPPQAPRSTGRRARRRSESRSAYLYLSPTILVMTVMMALPVVLVLGYSTLSNAVTTKHPRFVGLDNYLELVTDPVFRVAVKNTIVFTVLSVGLHLLIGLVFALMLNSPLLPRWLTAVFRTIYILPWVMTAAIVAVLWQLMLNPNGVVNFVLQAAHLIDTKVEWLSNPDLALGTVTFINVWAGYPFFMISILAGLQGIPGDLYEAAKVDGAQFLAQLRHITLPQLRPILLSMAMLDFIWNIQQFALVWLTTGGGPINATETIGTYTYKLAFSKYEFSLSATAGSMLFLACMVIAIFYVRKQRGTE